MVDSGGPSAGLDDAKKALQDLILFSDVPARDRMAMARSISDAYPPLAEQARKVEKRLKGQGSGPRYEVFYSVRPLVEQVVNLAKDPADLQLPVLTETLIMSLRLSTLLRSVDVSRIASALYVFEDKYFVRTVDKNGKKRTQNVCGATLKLLTAYLYRTKDHPAPCLIRHLNNLSLSTGSERIAKLAMRVMEACDIDTSVFKGHSVRGAAATYLLRLGVPTALVQAHGFWASAQTLDDYYARLHSLLDWDDILQGAAGAQGMLKTSEGNFVGVAGPVPTSGALETRHDVVRVQDEALAQQLEQLSALGILRKLYDSPSCPRCHDPIKREAAYVCQSCKKLHHVRCLYRRRDQTRKQTPEVQRQFIHQTVCSKCHYARQRAADDTLIDDPMGVTTTLTLI